MKTITILITLFLLIKYAIPYIRRQIKLYRTIKVVKTYIKNISDSLGQKHYVNNEYIVPNNLSETQNLDPKWNKGVVRGTNGRFMKKENNG